MITQNPHITPARLRDSQYAALFYVFDKLGRGHRFVVAEGINKAALLKESGTWSRGEQIMIKIALDLFDPGCVAENGYKPAGWGEAAAVLDGANLRTVIEAMHIVRGRFLPAAAE